MPHKLRGILEFHTQKMPKETENRQIQLNIINSICSSKVNICNCHLSQVACLNFLRNVEKFHFNYA